MIELAIPGSAVECFTTEANPLASIRHSFPHTFMLDTGLKCDCDIDLTFWGVKIPRCAKSNKYLTIQLYGSITLTFGVMCNTNFGLCTSVQGSGGIKTKDSKPAIPDDGVLPSSGEVHHSRSAS